MSLTLIIAIAVLVLAVLLTVLAYLLGLQLGGRQWRGRVEELQAESIRASRAMHDLTRRSATERGVGGATKGH
jgi:hypothetical protein